MLLGKRGDLLPKSLLVCRSQVQAVDAVSNLLELSLPCFFDLLLLALRLLLVLPAVRLHVVLILLFKLQFGQLQLPSLLVLILLECLLFSPSLELILLLLMVLMLIDLDFLQPLEARLLFSDLPFDVFIDLTHGALMFLLLLTTEFFQLLLDIDVIILKDLGLLTFQLSLEPLLQDFVGICLLFVEVSV